MLCWMDNWIHDKSITTNQRFNRKRWKAHKITAWINWDSFSPVLLVYDWSIHLGDWLFFHRFWAKVIGVGAISHHNKLTACLSNSLSLSSLHRQVLMYGHIVQILKFGWKEIGSPNLTLSPDPVLKDCPTELQLGMYGPSISPKDHNVGGQIVPDVHWWSFSSW